MADWKTTGISAQVGGLRVDRRRLFTVVGAGAGALSLGRLGASAQGTPEANAASGSITIYSGPSEDLVAPVLAMFTEATGISVEARYGNTAEMAAAILEEGNNSPADVYYAQDAERARRHRGSRPLRDAPEETLDMWIRGSARPMVSGLASPAVLGCWSTTRMN